MRKAATFLFEGKQRPVSEIAKITGYNDTTVRSYLKKGMTTIMEMRDFEPKKRIIAGAKKGRARSSIKEVEAFGGVFCESIEQKGFGNDPLWQLHGFTRFGSVD